MLSDVRSVAFLTLQLLQSPTYSVMTDLGVGRFRCSCGPFWTSPWAVLDLVYGPFWFMGCFGYIPSECTTNNVKALKVDY